MSKAAKRSLMILIVLLLAALGFAAVTVIEKQNIEAEKSMLENKFAQAQDQFQMKEKQYLQDARKLNDALKTAENEKTTLNTRIKEIQTRTEQQIAALSGEITEITADRDKWKKRIETIREERDALMSKIADLTKQLEEKPEPQIVYKEKIVEKEAPVYDLSTVPPIQPESGKIVDEQYWASLVQEKASLEIELNKLRDGLSAKSIEIVELKQNNEEMKLQFDSLKHEKGQIEADIQHKTNMIDNISLELARTKNDKKFIADRAQKLNAENSGLRTQLKQLVSVKNALEKNIVLLSQEKDKVEGRLGKTETLIQSKIDEIWEIKDDLDRSIRSAQTDTPSSEVELPPIVVSSEGAPAQYQPTAAPGFNGRVISVNEANNFVIVDIGENKGLNLGDTLSVYRDSKYIARLEVIQVRKDIAAADLKDQWTKVKVGDIIR